MAASTSPRGAFGPDAKGGAAHGRGLSRGAGLAAVVLVASVLRFSHLSAYLARDPFSQVPVSDAQAYVEQGREVARSLTFTDRAYYQPPLYPLALGLAFRTIGPSFEPIYAAQAVLGVATSALVWATALAAFGPGAALAAGLLAALFPYFAYFETKLLSDPLALFLQALLLWLLAPGGAMRGVARHAIAGAVCGLATITRAPSLLLVPVVLAAVLRREGGRGGSVLALAFLAGTSLPILPVLLHNVRAEGELLLVSGNGGENLWIGNHPQATGEYQRPPGFSADVRYQGDDALRLAGASTRAAASRVWTRRVLEVIASDPGRWLRLEVRKLRLLLSGRDVPLIYHFEPETAEFTPLLARLAPLPYALLLFGGFGLLAAASERRGGLLLGFLAVQVLVLLAFFVTSRFKLPFWLGLLPFAGLGMVRLPASFRSRRLALGFLASGALTLLVMRLDARYEPRPLAYWNNLGVAYTRLRSFERAEAALREALALAPGNAGTRFNLLWIRWEQGRDEEVIEGARALAEEMAIEGAGERGAGLEARGLLALALLRSGRAGAAEVELGRILAESPDDANARFNLAMIYGRTGRLVQAEGELRRGLGVAPRNGTARAQLGLLLLAQPGREREARAELERALEHPLDRAVAAQVREALGKLRPAAASEKP